MIFRQHVGLIRKFNARPPEPEVEGEGFAYKTDGGCSSNLLGILVPLKVISLIRPITGDFAVSFSVLRPQNKVVSYLRTY